MKEIFSTTAPCSPTGLPHCTRSPAPSRAVFSDHFAQAARVQCRQRDLQAVTFSTDQVLGRDSYAVQPGETVFDAAQSHELVAPLDGDAGRVGFDDERADAAAVPVTLRD